MVVIEFQGGGFAIHKINIDEAPKLTISAWYGKSGALLDAEARSGTRCFSVRHMRNVLTKLRQIGLDQAEIIKRKTA